ncbi:MULTISPECIES: hypothetical protein [unclassified Sphingomonas]|uniref:hypothetical protein n=1 Tax=unclassified Sphingomonas TaxID=196159 RepID=UPI0006F3FE47|nr:MULTISPECIES: hypothetical protein [unclassified Sphingomonas]KQM58768.1 hypothetical protein ASE65_10415 [Sphingomonas sp. Leaf16]KQN11023.1 hypothetical protein ASE81_11400 [Sphingomonas sp. Leaf29]
MALDRDIGGIIRKNQELVFRVAGGNGLTLKVISLDSGIPYGTLRSYAGNSGATVMMPLDALYKLVGVIPDELLSVLLPEGRSIVQVPDDIDHDAFEEMCRDYLAEKGKAHRPDSPGGREISGCESASLAVKAVALKVAG